MKRTTMWAVIAMMLVTLVLPAQAALVATTGGTMKGPLLSTSTSTNAPATNEMVTAWWVANNTGVYGTWDTNNMILTLAPGGGSGSGGGNVTNTGASVVGMIPVYTDTTGTQVTPTNAIASASFGTVTYSGATANTAAAFNASKQIVSSSTTDTELGYVHGVTSDIQSQLNGKQASSSVLTQYATIATNQLVTIPSATVLTNKTFDAAADGNVLKQTKYMLLMRPDYGDGTKAVPQTNTFTASGLMHYTFAGDGETNDCWVVYETAVPPDIDTSVPMTATIGFVSGGTDADTVTFHLTYALGAAGTALPTGTSIATSPIVVATAPTTPASGDVQQSAATTLTDWAASMTAGTPLFIRMARLNDSNDDTQRDLFLRISYGSTQ